GRAFVQPCDLTDLAAIDKLVADVLDEHGRVDILINNAGRSIRRSLELSYDRFHDFERTMQLNYFAAVRLMLGLLPGMRERGFGHVINISSVGVQTKVARFGAYIASKSAPTSLYDNFPTLTPEQAGDVICEAITGRPRRVSPAFGRFASFADALSPEIMDLIRNRGFKMFHDSKAAEGEPQPVAETEDDHLTSGRRAFVEVTRGVHW
ncbi:MAG: SDR family NAD(P)-dependent oxidoreductase, partial [Actinophytocola sp.]|nr:SDR family NAD(P)-dependent oxidoreductase [Actinophytocola sp.]